MPKPPFDRERERAFHARAKQRNVFFSRLIHYGSLGALIVGLMMCAVGIGFLINCIWSPR